MEGLQINERKGELNIHYRWKTPLAYFLIFFCVFWNGFMIVWYSIAISERVWMMGLFGLIHLGVGIGLIYYTISLFLNTTYITVTKDEITIDHKPIPAFMAGMKQLASRDIEQLYVKESISRGKNGTTTSYALRVKTKDGKDKELISSYVIQNSSMAQELEIRIEGFLGIRDYEVAEEFSSRGKVPAKEMPRPVLKNVDVSRLGIADLGKGDVVNYDLKSWEVVYETQYDWAASESDRLLQLASDAGDSILLYLHADMASTTIWKETKLETHQVSGDSITIEKEGAEIVQISYEGERYLLSDTAQGKVFARGRNAEGIEGKQWLYLSTDKQKSFRMLHMEGAGMSSYTGKLLREYEFSNILPSS